MKSLLFILLLVPGIFIGCQNEHEPITQNRSWGEPSNGLRCSISVGETSWSKGNPAIISVFIENVSNGKVNLKTIPSFTLNEFKFLCPIDIASGEYTLPANERSNISLDRGALLNRKIDVSKLRWGSGVQAIWPENSFDFVLPGNYKLRLDIEIVTDGQPTWIRSNVVEVDVLE